MSACVEWSGYRDHRGYGTVYVAADRTNKRAHRVAWEAAHGPIPPGLCVLHTCDNRACVNVEHLWLGTQVENIKDMDRKGRRRTPSAQWPTCRRGHVFDERNTRAWKGRRICRACDAERAAAARARRAA